MDERVKQLLTRGRDHYERRDFAAAEPCLREVLQHANRFADVHNMLGVIFHDRGDLAGAEAELEAAVELNGVYTEALLNLAVVYNDLGKFEAAREIYDRIRSLGSGQGMDPFARGKIANMHADVAQAYVDAGRPAEAIAELKKAVELCPSFADLQSRLAGLYRDAGNLALARLHFTAARDLNPTYVAARLQLGMTLLSLGEPAGARAEWNEVLALEPDNRNAKTYLRMLDAQARPSPLAP